MEGCVGDVGDLPDQLSLAELETFLAAQGVPRSRAALTDRCRRGRMGSKIGRQWVVSKSQALALAETLRAKKSHKGT